MDDENGNDRVYTMNTRAFQSLGDHRKALEYHEKQLKIAIEIGDRAREGTAYGNLSYTHRSLGDFPKAIEYTEKRLKIAIEIGDLAEEGAAYGNLGNAYQSLGDYQKAIDYHGKHLKIAQEISDRGGQGRAYGNLGNVYQSLCDYQKAIEYHEKHLKIAKEIGDRAGEGAAFGDLGNPFQSLGDYQKAIEYQEKHLKLAIEDRDRAGEGTAYGVLSYTYRSLGDSQKAFEYTENHLKIAIEDGDRTGEGTAYGNLGHIYRSLGDVRKATEYAEKHLKIAEEVGDWAGEGRAYENLGNTYQSVGDYEKAIECHEKHLKIAKEIGARAEEQRAYGNLGSAYQSQGDFQKGIAYDESILKIGREIGDWAGEGRVYGHLGNAYKSVGNYQEAIKYHEKRLTIAVDIGDRAGEGGTYGDLGNCYQSLGEYQKAIEYHEKHLKIAKEIGDRAGEGRAYHNIGYGYLLLEQLENAGDNFVSSVKTFNAVRSCLKAKDHWKIKFRELYEQTYTGLWKSLLRSNKVDEALFAADQGRAQTLSDNLLIQYKLPVSLSAATIDTKETISRLLTELSSPTLFLAIEGLTINIWFLRRGKEIAYRQGWIDGDRRDKDPIRVLVETAVKDIRAEINVKCEDRSFGEHDDPLKPFYDAVIGPILDLLGPEDDELVIVSDGVLCFTPWAAVIKSISIRTVPSLTSYQLISSVPEGYHQKTGALLVGNPYLKELKVARPDMPYAQKEVEMIASIFNTRPLTGKQATKAEVMRRMSSVGVIHIAAHANKHTGEIALSPNPGWTSKFPEIKDYILKMSDVQATNLRARLVVLSCSFSGRGRIFKGEGVVGIARAFLAAGARSVLVALWAIDDEATMVFMKSFYQHLKEGKTASAAVYQSMKSLRESKKFNKMGYWAPFQLIGDDVKIEFEVDDDVKKC